MKIRVMSDIHLEKQPTSRWPKWKRLDEDVMVFAGDIGEGLMGLNWIKSSFDPDLPKVYVPGNHEYWGNDMPKLNATFDFMTRGTKIKCCPYGTYEYVIGGESYLFIGTTMFTDFKLDNNPLSPVIWGQIFNDKIYTLRKNRSLANDTWSRYYRVAVWYLRRVLAATEGQYTKRILVTHFCPEWSIPARYRGDNKTPGYASRWPHDIVGGVDLIIHGHTHDNMMYTLPNGTKVVCNPRGFNNVEFDNELIVEI